jgi:hypothetical protein
VEEPIIKKKIKKEKDKEKKFEKEYKKEKLKEVEEPVVKEKITLTLQKTQDSIKATTSTLSTPKLVVPLDETEHDTKSSDSSSSEDQPIMSKEDAKRKVEVLSGTGKIGVTIKKTSPEPSTSKDKDKEKEKVKPTKIKLEKKSVTPIPIPIPIPIVVPEEQDSSDTNSSVGKKSSKSKVPAHTEDSSSDSCTVLSSVTADKSEKSETKELPKTPKKPAVNQPNHQQVIQASPKSVHPRLWLPTTQPSDQVFITDVTVNLETVTIRECKTERGFFRAREQIEQCGNLTKAQ